jgi:hypothetical protein
MQPNQARVILATYPRDSAGVVRTPMDRNISVAHSLTAAIASIKNSGATRAGADSADGDTPASTLTKLIEATRPESILPISLPSLSL